MLGQAKAGGVQLHLHWTGQPRGADGDTLAVAPRLLLRAAVQLAPAAHLDAVHLATEQVQGGFAGPGVEAVAPRLVRREGGVKAAAWLLTRAAALQDHASLRPALPPALGRAGALLAQAPGDPGLLEEGLPVHGSLALAAGEVGPQPEAAVGAPRRRIQVQRQVVVVDQQRAVAVGARQLHGQRLPGRHAAHGDLVHKVVRRLHGIAARAPVGAVVRRAAAPAHAPVWIAHREGAAVLGDDHQVGVAHEVVELGDFAPRRAEALLHLLGADHPGVDPGEDVDQPIGALDLEQPPPGGRGRGLQQPGPALAHLPQHHREEAHPGRGLAGQLLQVGLLGLLGLLLLRRIPRLGFAVGEEEHQPLALLAQQREGAPQWAVVDRLRSPPLQPGQLPQQGRVAAGHQGRGASVERDQGHAVRRTRELNRDHRAGDREAPRVAIGVLHRAGVVEHDGQP